MSEEKETFELNSSDATVGNTNNNGANSDLLALMTDIVMESAQITNDYTTMGVVQDQTDRDGEWVEICAHPINAELEYCDPTMVLLAFMRCFIIECYMLAGISCEDMSADEIDAEIATWKITSGVICENNTDENFINPKLPLCAIFDSDGYVVPEWIPFLIPVDATKEEGPFEWVVEIPAMSVESIEFAKRSQSIWMAKGNYAYDYSQVIYNGSTKKVIIRCVIHNNTFSQLPGNHTRSQGCKHCKSDPMKKVRKCHREHNKESMRYQYYTCPGTLSHSKDNIVMHCTRHGDIRPFGLTYDSHCRGNSGCKRCNTAFMASRTGENNPYHGATVKLENSLLYNFPDIAAEMVQGQRPADKISRASNIIVLWKCPIETHPEYRMSVDKRTLKGQKCPMCAKKIPSPEYNFNIVNNASEWWDFEKNGEVLPIHLLPNTKKQKFWFVCQTCMDSEGNPLHHSYMAFPNNFTSGERCPFAAGKRTGDANSFAAKCPVMSTFWDMTMNGGKSPKDLTYGSGQLCYFKCNACGNNWSSTPNATFRQFGDGGYCVKCAAIGCQTSRGEWLAELTQRIPNMMDLIESVYVAPVSSPKVVREKPPRAPNQSSIALQWLDTMGDDIMHSGNVGEFHIPGTPYYADGYDPTTNTIYEFNGCFWHGCDKCYHRDKKHPCIDKTFGELYDATRDRERRILKLGYAIIIIWEHEVRPMKHLDGTWSIPRK